MIKSIVISLVLTLLIENFLVLILGIRQRRDFVLISLANTVTNPIVVQTLNIWSYVFKKSPQWYVILLLEAAAVAAEGLLYEKKLCFRKINPFLLSLILNAASYFGGSVINEIFTKTF